ncbi:hypothetical protein CROQUDRAFT_657459 [Cronartium quercuum f. sp. fusiforme G11]|uniref:Uncharacterized protein n=1 Tax=Cronartium quercuum f. sp. fusiforme G11 TaxID=708437 RepID=A0A9P6NG68_9BASI|nr:hypothetical protein CROQUDRAFT_657459 [Cronartium quercuum f. sp. fusiforme G11]
MALMLALLPTQAQAHHHCSDRFEWINDDDDHDFNSQLFPKDCISDRISTGQIVGIILGSVGNY